MFIQTNLPSKQMEPWRNGSALVFGLKTSITKGCGFDPHGLRFCISGMLLAIWMALRGPLVAVGGHLEAVGVLEAPEAS
jgi:hypothetical protein